VSTQAPAPPSDLPVPPPPAPPRVRPSRGWYVAFGCLIAVSLIAAGVIWLAGRISVENQVQSFARYVAPGSAELRFKRAGQYTIYYEYRSEIDGEQVDAAETSPPPGIALDLTDESGQSLELRRPGREFRYDIGGFSGVSLRRVIIPRAGLYRLRADSPGSAPFALSVGRGATPSTDPFVQAAVLVGIIGTALGVIGMLTVGILRSRSRAGLGRGAAGPAPVPVPIDPDPGPFATPPAGSPVMSAPPPPPFAGAGEVPPGAGEAPPVNAPDVPPVKAPDGPPASSPAPLPPVLDRPLGQWAPPEAGTASDGGGNVPPPPPAPS
jgi:hypothetical protein